MKYKSQGLCAVSIDLVLATGRKVNLCPDRFRKFLLKWEFTSFVCAVGVMSGVASYMSLSLAPPVLRFTIFWTFSTVIVTALYVLAVSFASLVSRNESVPIFEPLLTALSAALAAPMCFSLMTVFGLELHFPGKPKTFFFVLAALTLEVGVLLFVYFLRDYLIEKYCIPFENQPSQGRSITIGNRSFPIDAITFVKAENQYVRVYHSQTSELLSGQLIDVARMLPDEIYLQPHRSYLVMKHAVLAYEKDPSGGSALLTRDGSLVPISRRKRSSTLAALQDVDANRTA